MNIFAGIKYWQNSRALNLVAIFSCGRYFGYVVPPLEIRSPALVALPIGDLLRDAANERGSIEFQR